MILLLAMRSSNRSRSGQCRRSFLCVAATDRVCCHRRGDPNSNPGKVVIVKYPSAILLLASAVTVCLAADAPFPDAVALSGKWHPVVWREPGSPRLTNVDAAGLTALPDDVTLTETAPVKLTLMQWGDCRLRFELSGPAHLKLMDLYDVVALAGPQPAESALYEVWFHAPRFQDRKLTTPPRLRIDVNGIPVRPMSSDSLDPAPAAAHINEVGEAYGPLRIEAVGGGDATLRNIWVGPLDPARDASGIAWRNMFDSKTLDGWSEVGDDADYRIEDGVLIGTSVPSQADSFLISNSDYENFELSVEFHASVTFNSGIQVRSQARGGNQIFGYQVDIDPSDRRWTAGLIDQARRGWLHSLPFQPELRYPVEKDRWHELRVLADGPTIKTWLDGRPVAHIYDSMTRRGLIGLQVRNVSAPEAEEIRWRNVRIREIR